MIKLLYLVFGFVMGLGLTYTYYNIEGRKVYTEKQIDLFKSQACYYGQFTVAKFLSTRDELWLDKCDKVQ